MTLKVFGQSFVVVFNYIILCDRGSIPGRDTSRSAVVPFEPSARWVKRPEGEGHQMPPFATDVEGALTFCASCIRRYGVVLKHRDNLKYITERCGQVVSIPSYSGGPTFRIRSGEQLSWL
jgi:hypothetical protein